MTTTHASCGAIALAAVLACGGTSEARPDPTMSVTLGDGGTTSGADGAPTTSADHGDVDDAPTIGSDDTGADSSDGSNGCVFCDAPNEACVDGECVTTCQGQIPDPCGPAQICDVLSGECRDPGAACTLAGAYSACGGKSCGPGSVCDDAGECIAIAPCGDVVCLDDGACWGSFCSCERQSDCVAPPDGALLNGPFATDIGGLEFADDCTAWMVTLRSGADYLRRLDPDGVLTEWAGVANLNMGEVKVLKALLPPPQIGTRGPDHLGAGSSDALDRDRATRPTAGVEGLGEVAITYTCCSSCGCQATPPQGVARLDEDAADPLPIVIVATVTQGTGPFGSAAADAGPHGLTWGIDRVLYVGNSTNNGDVNVADLDAGTQGLLATLDGRVTAGAPVSAVHLLFAIEGGAIVRFNAQTQSVTAVTQLAADVTSLSHDSFSGLVYAALRDLDVVSIDPFTGDVTAFDAMPAAGRVAVSPDGQLWYTPVAYLTGAQALFAWDLPDAF